MAALTSPPLRASLVTGLLVALLAMLLPTATLTAHADSGTEGAFVAALNQERAAAGLTTLTIASDLTATAREHSADMADGTNLHHNPNLGSDVRGWQKVGENVGRGPSVTAIHDAFLASPSHLENVMDTEWTELGIGVVVSDETIWVTVLFRLPAGSAPPAPVAAPAPDATPEPISLPAGARRDWAVAPLADR